MSSGLFLPSDVTCIDESFHLFKRKEPISQWIRARIAMNLIASLLIGPHQQLA